MSNLYAVIMAGGSGTRFWPASRSRRPKQLLALAPGSSEPLIAATARRILPICPPPRVLVVTGEHLRAATCGALPDIPEENVLAEPTPRNTAPCIGWAASVVHRADPSAVVMVLPSDHHISDEEGFRTILRCAVDFASRTDHLVTVGVEPTRPETGYGYIESGAPLEDGVRAVARFVEKPNAERAAEYVASGRYFWNSGMFFFRASAMLDAIRSHLPDLARGLEQIGGARTGGPDDALGRVFPTLPSISIDNGVMEKAARIAVVPGSFGWSDVGSWQAAWELAPKDGAGNATCDGAFVVDGRGNFVTDLSSARGGRVIALVGVSDLAVVETDDALLVMAREKAQDVRKAIEALKAQGRNDKL